MQKITIGFTGKQNLILQGDLLAKNFGRNTVWTICLTNDNSDNEVNIPSASCENKNIIMTITTDASKITPSSWIIEAVEPDKNIYKITSFPNAFELTKYLNEK